MKVEFIPKGEYWKCSCGNTGEDGEYYICEHIEAVFRYKYMGLNSERFNVDWVESEIYRVEERYETVIY